MATTRVVNKDYHLFPCLSGSGRRVDRGRRGRKGLSKNRQASASCITAIGDLAERCEHSTVGPGGARPPNAFCILGQN